MSRLGYWCLAALALLLPACGAQGPKKLKVAVVTNNPDPFWNIVEAGARKAEKEFDVEVLFQRPAQGDAGLQKEIIDTLLTKGINGVALSVLNPEGQTDYLNKVAEKVPLITQDNDAPNSKRLCYIGTDNYLAGKAVGTLIKEALPNGGKVAIFVGSIDPLNAQQRQQGILDELAGMKDAKGTTYGKYKLLGTFTDEADKKRAKDNATDVLTKNPDAADLCLAGLWNSNPPACLQAVLERYKDKAPVKIVGFDENPETLKGIADGHIYGTVVQQPFLFGYESVKVLAKVAQGDKSVLPANGINAVPHKIIKKDNVDAFTKELAELMGKK
jgi:ribose transport system substrate-binding protein